MRPAAQPGTACGPNPRASTARRQTASAPGLAPPFASTLARTLGLTLALAVFAGCAAVDPDAGLAPVQRVAQERLGKDLRAQRSDADRDAVARRVTELLVKPLDADAAVQIALLNHAGLQATLAEIGIGAAELAQAGRLPNPGFGFARSTQGDEVELERSLHINLARLLALPLARQVEARRFAQTQAQVTSAVIAHAADTRRAWVQAVAAAETARYMQQVMDAAEASAELARRMAGAGNFNKLQQAREQGFYAEAALNAARAEQRAAAARERLVRLLGLWGAQTAFRLPERLPDLPAAPRELPDLERRAVAERLDVQGARLAVEQTAKNLGLVRTTRFVNVLEFGLARETNNEGNPTRRSWEIGFELPLFDWGDARVARAEAVYMQAMHRAAATAIDARSEVREAYAAYRHGHDIARHHRDEMVPIARRISEENLLRYNGMLIGVFELLADARAQIGAVNAAIEALRDFWLADADLEMALIGKPTLMLIGAPPAAAATGGDAGH